MKERRRLKRLHTTVISDGLLLFPENSVYAEA